MIDKIEEIITRAYLAEPTGNKRAFPFMNTPEWGRFVKGAAEMQVLELKSLFKEYAMEILNELESKEEFVTYKKDNGHGIAIPVSHLIEQREKLLTED